MRGTRERACSDACRLLADGPGRSGSPRQPELTHAPRTVALASTATTRSTPRAPRLSLLGSMPAREQAGKRPAPTRLLPDSRCAASTRCTAPHTMHGRPATEARCASLAAIESVRRNGVERRRGSRARSWARRRSGARFIAVPSSRVVVDAAATASPSGRRGCSLLRSPGCRPASSPARTGRSPSSTG
jgi:hypothetical protein